MKIDQVTTALNEYYVPKSHLTYLVVNKETTDKVNRPMKENPFEQKTVNIVKKIKF